MKNIGRGHILEQGNTALGLDDSIRQQFRIGKDSVLHSVLVSKGGKWPLAEKPDPSGQWITLVASTIPAQYWEHIFRCSLTLSPRRGALNHMFQALKLIGIKSLYVDSANGLDLSETGLYKGKLSSLRTVQPEQRVKLIIPSTIVVLFLEYPCDDWKSRLTEAIYRSSFSEIQDARTAIEGAIKDPSQTDSARRSLETALKKVLPHVEDEMPELNVNWLSPMATLNVLGRHLSSSARTEVRSSEMNLSDPGLGENVRLIRISENQDQEAWLDLSAWKNAIWDLQSTIPDFGRIEPEGQRLCLQHGDSHERCIIVDLFSSDADYFVCYFQLLAKGGRLFDTWFSWILERLKNAKGNILTTETLAPQEGGWVVMGFNVLFRLRQETGLEDITRVLRCLFEIQGQEGRTDAFEDLVNQVSSEVPGQHGSVAREEQASNALQSTLKSVRVWDPNFKLKKSYVKPEDFHDNPYSFTRPLNRDSYRALYPSTDSLNGRSRIHLANQIIRKLLGAPGDNIAIIGAHRSGKTSVLNLVEDLLNDPEIVLHETNREPIVVRVNASVTPPLYLITEIAEKVREHRRNPKDRPLNGIFSSRSASDWLNRRRGRSRVIKSVRTFGQTVTLEPESASARRSRLSKSETPSDLANEIAWDFGEITLLQSVQLFKEQLKELQVLIAGFSASERLIVVVDELPSLSRWSQAETFPIWRHLIEDRSFAEIRWLIAASRGISDSTGYSPLTNLFREYNVGSLRAPEANALLQAFSKRGWVKDNWIAESPKLSPLMTFGSEQFLLEITDRLPYLLQACCHYLYDKFTGLHIPIVTLELCQDIIVHEVLAEVTEYLSNQWKKLPERVQGQVKSQLARCSKDPIKFFSLFKRTLPKASEVALFCRKPLQRSGLQGESGYVVAPLVAFWIISSFEVRENPVPS